VKSSAQTFYQAITSLGRGGMGEVYLAALPGPPGLNQLAVIKRVWPELADDPEFVAMFLDEAQLALRLRHPNIVQTFDVGEEVSEGLDGHLEGGRYFIAMEYLAGQSLALVLDRLRGSPSFGLSMRLQVLMDVLRALEYAHGLYGSNGEALGIVHRDVSPHNVVITYDGVVKLMDFGVAKSVLATHQTGPGVVKGRFAYGAPEQLRGLNVDARADLFSVGVMLRELITERRMFQGRTGTQIVNALTGGEPLPPLPHNPAVPEALRRICDRALALNPSERYQSAADFLRDLGYVLRHCLAPDPRPLGKLVACAFRNEKQSMEWLIERHFQQAQETPGASRSSGSYRTITAPAIEISDITVRDVMPRRRLGWKQVMLGSAAVAAGMVLMAALRPIDASEHPPVRRLAGLGALAPAMLPPVDPLPAVEPLSVVVEPPPPPTERPTAAAAEAASTPPRPVRRRRLAARLPAPVETEATEQEPEELMSKPPRSSRRLPPMSIDTRNPYRP
jgi:serine/threonine protein kinase